MRLSTIGRLRCPYCRGRFGLRKETTLGERVQWGLLRCRCFEFPIVDGIVLLSLSKGYGGSEERLQPYVPLQVAAIEYVQQGDIDGLRSWISRHVPLLSRLIDGRDQTYLEFMQVLTGRLAQQVELDLSDWGRFEVIGARRPRAWRWVAAARGLRGRLFPRTWSSFYLSRFVGTGVAAIRRRTRSLPFDGPLLSLCCGHGPFELMARAREPGASVLSLDGQLLNLYVTRRFVAPDGEFVCHDVQFPLPFDDGAFRGVFSSSCLGEIPAQATFVGEAARVTAPEGWTLFDDVAVDPGRRIDGLRFYRVCQNHFEKQEDYRDLMQTCGARPVLWLEDDSPEGAKYSNDPRALSGRMHTSYLLGAEPGGGDDGCLSSEERSWLHVNPRYAGVTHRNGQRTARLPADPDRRLTPGPEGPEELPELLTLEDARLGEAGYLEELFARAAIVLLPDEFARDCERVIPR